MTNPQGRIKMTVIDNKYVQCPVCKRNHRLLEVTEPMVMYNVPVYCRKCGSRIIVDVVDGKVYMQCPAREAPSEAKS